ncbi:MAG: hypothetical protein ACYDA0_05235 [Candidatus Dormibacteraceae bacterium]
MAQNFSAKEATMECDICGQGVENSEDLQKHKERAHPTGVSDKSMGDLEQPDLLGDSPEESAAIEVPKPTY